MSIFEKILVIIDFDEEEQVALKRTLDMHHKPGTEIMLFSNIYQASIEANFMLDPENIVGVKTAMIEYQNTRLNKLIADNKQANISFIANTVWMESEHISELSVIEEFKPDLLVKSNRPQKNLSRWLFASSDAQLLKACPCPILFVSNSELGVSKSVLAAIDPTEPLSKQQGLDQDILEAAHYIANDVGFSLHCCHCFDPSFWEIFVKTLKSTRLMGDFYPDKIDNETGDKTAFLELQTQHQTQFNEACEQWISDTKNKHFLHGSASEEIPKLASNIQASMIVIGSTNRTGLLGSTAESILDTIELDLLVIKPASFKSTKVKKLVKQTDECKQRVRARFTSGGQVERVNTREKLKARRASALAANQKRD